MFALNAKMLVVSNNKTLLVETNYDSIYGFVFLCAYLLFIFHQKINNIETIIYSEIILRL